MNEQANVDVIQTNGSGGLRFNGSVAMRLLKSGFKASALRNNDVLKFRDWIDVDSAVVAVARQRLVGVQDLISRGLTYNVANAMGITRVEWETVSDFGDAQVNMSGVAEGINDRITYDLAALPLPIVHKDFQINIRALQASRNSGQPLDTTQVSLATRIVVERIEQMLFDGGGTYGTGQTIYGYKTAPNAYTTALTYNWNDPAVTGEHRVDDVLKVIAGLQAKHMYGPYLIYIPLAWYTLLGDDYKANGDRTMLERLKAIPGISDIKPSENLSATTGPLVMVQLTNDVVDMVNGIQPMAVSWPSHGGFVENFKILAIMVPRFKVDQALQSGVARPANGVTTP